MLLSFPPSFLLSLINLAGICSVWTQMRTNYRPRISGCGILSFSTTSRQVVSLTSTHPRSCLCGPSAFVHMRRYLCFSYSCVRHFLSPCVASACLWSCLRDLEMKNVCQTWFVSFYGHLSFYFLPSSHNFFFATENVAVPAPALLHGVVVVIAIDVSD